MSVTLHCDVGDLKLELYCEECPKTAKNFIALAASGYYDGCKFHRNIKGFMAQTGDPTGTASTHILILYCVNGSASQNLRVASIGDPSPQFAMLTFQARAKAERAYTAVTLTMKSRMG